MNDTPETPREARPFDPSTYPEDTLFHERRTGQERRHVEPEPEVETTAPSNRRKKERRRRVDPTTFEKQYTPDELEFMNAMQRFKVQSGKPFPTHGEVLAVALSLGYRRVERIDETAETGEEVQPAKV